MKIALIGTRGIPARHGGFETCVEEVGMRLVAKGHHVTVYSKRSKERVKHEYKGMKIVYIPRIPIKGFETIFAAFLSMIHSLLSRFDVHMVFDSANSPILFFFKLFKKNYVINPDGLGWKRDKWGFLARKYYKFSEWITARTCKNIVTDSYAMQDYYKSEYGVKSTVIAYGANVPVDYNESEKKEVLMEMGLPKQGYFLQITRFEPENNPLLSLKAFNSCSTEMKMVLVGGTNYRTGYIQKIKGEARKNPNIILPGFIYDQRKRDILWNNCFCYIHGNYLGGTNPALLQAMAAGRPVIALDCMFNREVLDTCGFFFARDTNSLRSQMQYVAEHRTDAEQKAKAAFERMKHLYNWDLVTNQYESLFCTIVET